MHAAAHQNFRGRYLSSGLAHRQYTKVQYSIDVEPSKFALPEQQPMREKSMQPATLSAHCPLRTPVISRPNPMDSLGKWRSYAAGETVYGQEDVGDYWYRLADGAARKCTLASDGRRQIVDFLMPGDLFGFHAGSRQDCSVECITSDTTVVRFQRQQMESLMESDPHVARQVREIAFASIDRMQSRMILLGRSRALERVCGFLIEIASRAQLETEGIVGLPMSRYDIADYLAIAVETVSRSLTTLRSKQVIAFLDTRHFRIVNPRALEAQCCISSDFNHKREVSPWESKGSTDPCGSMFAPRYPPTC
jgi:CRP/FNR family nitrogen fixation transcriptional regulator